MKRSKPALYKGIELDEDTVTLINRLEANKWVYKPSLHRGLPFRFTSRGIGLGAYVGKKFVVKNPHYCGEKPKTKVCPTYNLECFWVVQPTVRVFGDLPKKVQKEWEKKGKVAKDAEGDYYLVRGGTDAHYQNFGVYKGKLKQFDW